jgi:murein DD-endopeptidase MepM/ murein hydrolase activator NlpD
VALFVGASSPAIAQRTPRFLFPGLASAGAALLVLSVIRAARDYRRGVRRPTVGLAITAVATLLFAVLPFARFVYMMAPSAGGAPRILAGFGDWRGSEGYPRLDPHRGIDVKGRVGGDVLAAVARDSQDLCGLIVVVVHDPHGYRTIYCHLAVIAVTVGETVARDAAARYPADRLALTYPVPC